MGNQVRTPENSMKKTPPSLLSALALLLLAPSLLAQSQVSQEWLAELKETDQLLHDHQWQKAEKQGRSAGSDIVNSAGTGEGAAYSLAVISTFRAIAEAGLGHQEDAEWFWDMALDLSPDVAKTNIAVYGPAAVELSKRTLRIVDPKGDLRPRIVGPDGQPVEHPRIVHQTKPEYPKSLGLLHAEGGVVISTIVGVDGRTRRPVILDAHGAGPALEYAALDSVRQWRFEPAKLDGKPVAVSYVITVNFEVRKR
jgi:TonB family protein